MNKFINRRATILAIAAATFILPVAAQTGGTRNQQVAGTWMLVSLVNTMPDGKKVDVFGKDPKGRVILTPDGFFAVLFMREGLPKFASGARATGTPEENQAVVQGSLAYSGTYTVDAKDKVLVMNVDASTFPAWTGQSQKRKFTLEGDRLQWVGITGTQGGNVLASFKRAK